MSSTKDILEFSVENCFFLSTFPQNVNVQMQVSA